MEGERLLLEATHKYSAATAEIRRLSTEGAIGKSSKNHPGLLFPLLLVRTTAGCENDSFPQTASSSKGAISISGLSLPLKADFIRILRSGADDTVHYFVVLVKYRSRVIATQMLSTIDGIDKNKLHFSNLINLRDLDLDFQIYIEVYGLQTRRENIAHDVKYHIRKEKSMFNLTPLKKMKKQDSRARNTNPVNSKTIRRPAFGMVGYAVVNIRTLKNRAFTLEKVPEFSPLDGGLEMTLTIHSENRVEQRGFLTMFTDANGYGDWCRRWAKLSGNQLHFWKYPEDEGRVEPSESADLSSCITDDVTLAPREICSRMNTLMLETVRRWRQGDKESLIMHVVMMTFVLLFACCLKCLWHFSQNRKSGETTTRHLLSADTREDRLGWCSILNTALNNMRAWDPTAFRPRASSQSSTTASEAPSSTSTDIW